MNENIKSRYETRAQILKALAHPTRLYLVDILSKKSKNVGELTELVQSDMSTVSKHLSILKNSGIVSDQKIGTQVLYKLKMPCVLNFFGCVEMVLKERSKEILKVINR